MSQPSSSQRPLLLSMITMLFFLLPPANWLVRANLANTPLSDWRHILDAGDLLGVIAFLFPIAVGLGLALARAWGFWLFMAYAPTLIAFNVRAYVERPYLFNAGALVETAFAFALVGYFLQRDVYKPLLAASKRGWRQKVRFPIEIEVAVDGQPRKTRDFGENGCYVRWPEPPPVGERVRVAFELGGERFDLAGLIARVDGGGAGVHFPAMAEDRQSALRRSLRAAAPRREIPLARNLAVVGAVMLLGAGAGVVLKRAPHHPHVAQPAPAAPSGPDPCDLAAAHLPWPGQPPSGEAFSKRCSHLSDAEKTCLFPPKATTPECNPVRDKLLAP